MTLSLPAIKTKIEAELSAIDNSALREAIRSNLISPRLVEVLWDYGAPDERFPAWLVLRSLERPYVSIVHCEEGFGPGAPWGLVGTEEEATGFRSGMDSSWYASLELVYGEL